MIEQLLIDKTISADGLSLSREAVGPQGAAATGVSGKIYHITQASVWEIEQVQGITVFADSNTHALIPEMNSALRQSSNPADKEKRKEWARALQLLIRNGKIVGPYAGAR